MYKTLDEIAKVIGGEVIGDGSIKITGINGIKEAKPGELTFVVNSKYALLAEKTRASGIIYPKNMELPDKPVILSDDPSGSFFKALSIFTDGETYSYQGIHSTAIVAKDAKIGKNVTLGPNVVVEPKVSIGDNTIVEANCYIGFKSVIGKDVRLYPNISIAHKSVIGNRVKIFSGTVIGSDGFGFEQVNGEHMKVPQVGIVVIEDDVEIGANVTIDRARFSETVIGRGTKIDNLVQIGHNVIIGENCIIVAQVGIGGSTIIGKNSILAGQAGVVGHITIGEGSVVAAQAGVIGSLPPKSKVSGYPAKPHFQAQRAHVGLHNLPEFIKRIKELEKKIAKLESDK
ncbi:MAG: UDP-3-O-(3-hydroxymyristoyl)glucosamine N-acyltransferase [Candidatus Omnitrophica bacterium]|nr:UDP-3-O-(3-hydroxymyristoyl)glucosamine N-acyltransferase [Candidatus Omnitrophota bacterium]